VKRERRHDRARRDRQQDRQQKERKADQQKKDKNRNRETKRTKGDQLAQPGRVGDVREFCAGPEILRLQQTELCTHGPDPAPPRFAINSPAPLLSAAAAEREAAAIVCQRHPQSPFRA
jgi:hypothetical protein